MQRRKNSCVSILQRPRTFPTVEPAVFVYMFAVFLSYSTFQQLLYSRICHDTTNCTITMANDTNDTSSCGVSNPIQENVRTQTSHWILYNNIAMSIPAIVVSLFYGTLSDLFGRRIFIVLPPLGGAINSAVVLAVMYLNPHSLSLYLIGSFMAGLTGNFALFNFAVYSYLSDITPTSQRTLRIGVLESMTYFGATLSGIVGGIWINNEGITPPYWGILACNCIVVIYCTFCLPRSRQRSGDSTQTQINPTHRQLPNVQHTYSSEQRDILVKSSSNEVCKPSSISQVVKAVFKNLLQFVRIVFSSWQILLLFLVFFIVEINFLGIIDIVILYSFNRLCWTSDLLGYFLAAKVFCNGLAAILILPLLTLCGISDTILVIIGLVSGIGALVTMGTATRTWIMMLAPVIGAMRGCVVPVIRSMLSKLTPPTQQGVLFSGVGILEAMCTLVASSLYNALFPATYHISPGFCFYSMSIALLIPIILIIILHVKNKPFLSQPFLSQPNNVSIDERRPFIR